MDSSERPSPGDMDEESVEDLQAPAAGIKSDLRCAQTCPPYTCLNPSCTETVIE